MAKSEKTPEKTTDPVEVVEVVKEKDTSRIKKQWDEKHAGKGKRGVPVPGSDTAIEFTRLEVEDNAVHVWLSEDTSMDPDYVIVNPPTSVYISNDVIIDNPLGAIAYAINGAIK